MVFSVPSSPLIPKAMEDEFRRLVEENGKIKDELKAAQSRKSAEWLPPWVFERSFTEDITKFSKLGQLFVRLSGRPMTVHSDPAVKFGIMGIEIIEATNSIDEGEVTVTLVIRHKHKLMLLHDDPNLFPSDALITKLLVLADNPTR